MANAGHVEITLFNLSRVDLAPGDVLVYRHPKRVSQDSIAWIKKQVADVFPGHRVCVVDDGAELAVLRPVEQGVGSAPTFVDGPESIGVDR